LINTLRPEWLLSEASYGAQALLAIQSDRPDIVIMDITMPGISGLEVASKLREAGFDCPILMFTMHKSDELGKECRRAGAQGYVLKSQATEDLINAIDTLLTGSTFYGGLPEPDPGPARSDKPNLDTMFCSGLKFAFA
jgi:DNA-binding NarL/FixJ family response regulator